MLCLQLNLDSKPKNYFPNSGTGKSKTAMCLISYRADLCKASQTDIETYCMVLFPSMMCVTPPESRGSGANQNVHRKSKYI